MQTAVKKEEVSNIWKVIFASSAGTLIEWYDFYIFGSLAVIIADQFFPKGNPTVALLSTLATFATGFIVRPFGALFFGRIGDLVGRKYAFLLTLLIMGGATTAIGLLPNYETIGVFAPILLLLLRLLQGLALGGEYGGAFGELLWSATKGYISVLGVAIVASFFGLIDTWRILPALLVLLLMCWVFASIAMIVTSYAKNYDSFIYSTSGFIVPMSLLSGTYFPIDQLPGILKYLAYLLPLTHAVQAVRGILTVGWSAAIGIHILVLLFSGLIAMNIAIHRIRRRLLK